MADCTCQPGSVENNWTEQRCQACRDAEAEEWEWVTAWSRDVVRTLVAEGECA